jgi:hypothetical protein
MKGNQPWNVLTLGAAGIVVVGAGLLFACPEVALWLLVLAYCLPALR